MITRKNLNKRICDCEDCENDQTYYEFIRESEDTFGLLEEDINNMDDEGLQEYLDFLDNLWGK